MSVGFNPRIHLSTLIYTTKENGKVSPHFQNSEHIPASLNKTFTWLTPNTVMNSNKQICNTVMLTYLANSASWTFHGNSKARIEMVLLTIQRV